MNPDEVVETRCILCSYNNQRGTFYKNLPQSGYSYESIDLGGIFLVKCQCNIFLFLSHSPYLFTTSFCLTSIHPFIYPTLSLSISTSLLPTSLSDYLSISLSLILSKNLLRAGIPIK